MIDVVIIPGDGIGPEIVESVKFLFEKALVPVNWIEAQAGERAYRETGSWLPDETVDLVRRFKLALKGPTTTPAGGGHRSVNVALRQRLGLFANVRPAVSLPGIETKFGNIDLITVRENVEDTYSGIEYMKTADVAWGIKLSTRPGARRVIRYAFEFAKQRGRSKVTCVNKANIHKLTDGIFLETFREIASEYEGIEADEKFVDNACMQIVSDPSRFDVIVTPNLYGDIISDLMAGLVGGLGVTPAANIGADCAVFEAVHGSAPDIAGKGIANPTALILSSLMLLDHAGLSNYSEYIYAGLCEALKNGCFTKDLGGDMTLMEFTEAVAGFFDREHMTYSGKAPSGAFSVPVEKGAVKEKEGKLVGVDLFVEAAKVPSAPECPQSGFAYKGAFEGGKKLEEGEETFSGFVCLSYSCTSSEADPLRLLDSVKRSGLSWVSVEKVIKYD